MRLRRSLGSFAHSLITPPLSSIATPHHFVGGIEVYTPAVESKLAAGLREDDRRAERALSPTERLLLAQRLGDAAVAMYARAHRMTLDKAGRELARRRQDGRRVSRVAAVS